MVMKSVNQPKTPSQLYILLTNDVDVFCVILTKLINKQFHQY